IEREQLQADVHRRIIERIERNKKQSSTGTEKSEEKTEEKKDNFKPSKYLTKLQSDLTAAFDRVKAAGCSFGAWNPLLDRKECKAIQDEPSAKWTLVIRQNETERQKQEAKEETEKRWKELDKIVADIVSQSKIHASVEADLEARCLPSDVLTSPPKK